jgi:hypothetical protein
MQPGQARGALEAARRGPWRPTPRTQAQPEQPPLEPNLEVLAGGLSSLVDLPTARSCRQSRPQLGLHPFDLRSRPSACNNTRPRQIAGPESLSKPIGFGGDNHKHDLGRARARHHHADHSRVFHQLRGRLKVLLAWSVWPTTRGRVAGRVVPSGLGLRRPTRNVLLVDDQFPAPPVPDEVRPALERPILKPPPVKTVKVRPPNGYAQTGPLRCRLVPRRIAHKAHRQRGLEPDLAIDRDHPTGGPD